MTPQACHCRQRAVSSTNKAGCGKRVDRAAAERLGRFGPHDSGNRPFEERVAGGCGLIEGPSEGLEARLTVKHPAHAEPLALTEAASRRRQPGVGITAWWSAGSH